MAFKIMVKSTTPRFEGTHHVILSFYKLSKFSGFLRAGRGGLRGSPWPGGRLGPRSRSRSRRNEVARRCFDHQLIFLGRILEKYSNLTNGEFRK